MDKTTNFTPSLTLSSDGAGWVGTFGVLVRTLAADLLDEGPVYVRASTFDQVTVLGEWTALEGMNLVIDGTEIDIENLSELSVE